MGLGFLQFIWLARKNWKAFFGIVVPAMLIVWLVFPATVAGFIIALGFIGAAVYLVGGFILNLWRGWKDAP